MRFLLSCPVLSNEQPAPGHHRLRLHAPEMAAAAQPGQFCMVEVAESLYPFLRRPMCFERIYADGVGLLFKVEGEGTRLLSRVVPGQRVSLQGPLGNGFPLDPGYARHVIVSGGIGVATFPALAAALIRVCARPPEVILAARTRELLLCEDEFRGMGCPLHPATDDGTAGRQAYASQVLETLDIGPDTRVYACGPMAMMRATADVAAARGANCLVSLEAQMACGDGACLGCVVESTREIEGEKMVRVCVDGPVFDTTLIDWEAHNTAYDL